MYEFILTFLVIFVLIVGALLIISKLLADRENEITGTDEDLERKIRQHAGVDEREECASVCSTNGFPNPVKKCLVLTQNYESLGVGVSSKDGPTAFLLKPNDVLEANFKTVEGETITQITGKGALVTVGAGLAFGIGGALVGATTAARETVKKNPDGPTTAVLEIIHSKSNGPRFTMEVMKLSRKEMEDFVGDWNARLKLFMSKKSADV